MNKLLRNEEMFSDLNLRVTQVTAGVGAAELPKDFILQLYCECANKLCNERLSIAHNTYADIKKKPNAYVVRPEHYLPEFERLMQQASEYWVITKRLEKLTKDFEV